MKRRLDKGEPEKQTVTDRRLSVLDIFVWIWEGKGRPWARPDSSSGSLSSPSGRQDFNTPSAEGEKRSMPGKNSGPTYSEARSPRWVTPGGAAEALGPGFRPLDRVK